MQDRNESGTSACCPSNPNDRVPKKGRLKAALRTGSHAPAIAPPTLRSTIAHDKTLFGGNHMRKTSAWMALTAGATFLAWATMAMGLGVPAPAAPAPVPKFEVDPFWRKPLPNNWTLGQVGGIAVDERDHVWIIQRPSSLTRGEKLASTNPPTAKCCVPAPSIIEFDPEGNVVQAWGAPGQGYD